MSGRTIFFLMLRLGLAGVFIAAALPKIMDPQSFADSVRSYRLASPYFSAWIALFLPWLELVVGVGLLLPALRRLSGILIATLLLLFLFAHASAWIRGLSVDCACFGEASGLVPGYPWLLLRNGGLLLAALLLLSRDVKIHPADRSPLPPD